MSRGQLYWIAQSLFIKLHFLQYTICCCYSKGTIYNKDRHSDILFLTKERVFSQMAIANIYN